MIKTALTIATLTALLGPSPSFSASDPVPATTETVVKVATVTTRDAGGRARLFTDTRNREFAVKHDADQRISAIEATRGPHKLDVVSVGYDDDGRLIGARFRTGYTMFFERQPNGAQVVRDSAGGLLIRAGRSATPLNEGATAEQSAKLAATMVELETLLGALGQSVR